MTASDPADVGSGGPATKVGRVKRLALLGGAGAAALSVAGLVSYAPGLQALGSIRADLVPMAPSTGVSFLLLAAILIAQIRTPASRLALGLASGLALLVAVFGLAVVVGTLLGTTLTLEDRLLPDTFTVSGIRVGRMSILTGATFIPTGAGMVLLLWRVPGRPPRERFGDAAAIAGVVAVLVGVTDLLAYLYGSPLLYGVGAVPMAVTTALAFVFLGVGMVATAGLGSYPARMLVGDSTNARLLRALLPLVVVLVVTLGIINASIRGGDTLTLATEDVVVGIAATLMVAVIVRAVGTRLEASERRLRESEARHRTILQTTMDGFWLLDADGRLRDVNEAYCRMSGYDRVALLGMRVTDLESADTVDATLARLRDLAAAGEDRFESRHRRRDGVTFPVEISVRTQPLDGGRLTSAFITDLTERKAADAARLGLEAELAHAQRLESVGRLAGGVAHDFNNMLSVILGNVEYALTQVAAGEPIQADLLEIQKAAQRSAELTYSLLAFARAEATTPSVLDLNAALPSTIGLLRRLIGENVHLAWKPGADLWHVRLDPSQLDRVLANLCINARDAIAGVGTITIATDNVVLDTAFAAAHPSAALGDHVRVRVSDTGVGMSSEVLSHAFEPFFTTKPQGAGTGLGLATVYGIVRQNDGFITLASQLGRGTTFDIYLPRHAGDGADAPLDVLPPAVSGGRETILVVEDEPAILRLLTRTLEARGYTVIGTSDPAQALAIASRPGVRIDLLVTDVVMPGMSGPNLATALRVRHPTLRRVFMSGYSDREIGDIGALFIGKPFAMDDIAATVRAALDGR